MFFFCNTTLTAYFPGSCKYAQLPDLIDNTRVFCWKLNSLYVTRLVKPTIAKIHSSLLILTHAGKFWGRTKFCNPGSSLIRQRAISWRIFFFFLKISIILNLISLHRVHKWKPSRPGSAQQWRNHGVGGPRVGGLQCKPTERTREVDGD